MQTKFRKRLLNSTGCKKAGELRETLMGNRLQLQGYNFPKNTTITFNIDWGMRNNIACNSGKQLSMQSMLLLLLHSQMQTSVRTAECLRGWENWNWKAVLQDRQMQGSAIISTTNCARIPYEVNRVKIGSFHCTFSAFSFAVLFTRVRTCVSVFLHCDEQKNIK